MDTEIFRIVFNELPYNVKFYIAVGIVIVFFLWLFLNFIINPNIIVIQSLFSRHNNKLIEIINDPTTTDNELKTECGRELILNKKLELVQCKCRNIATYFYELTNKSNHLIPYNKFKRLYKYFEFINGKPNINKKMIRSSRRYELCLAMFFFSLMGISAFFFVYVSSLNNFGSRLELFTLVLTGFFEICALKILFNRIHKKEIDEFVKITNFYNDEVQVALDEQSIKIT